MEIIKDLVRNLAIIVLLTAFLDMLLPSGSMRKYLKVVMGLFVMITVLNPVLTLLNRDLAPEITAWHPTVSSGEFQSILAQGQALSEQARQGALADYKNRVARQIEALARLVPGVGAVRATVELSGQGELSGMGALRRVVLEIETGTPRDELPADGEELVTPVEILVTVGEKPNEAGPSSMDGGHREETIGEEAKRTVSSFYGLSSDQVEVRFVK